MGKYKYLSFLRGFFFSLFILHYFAYFFYYGFRKTFKYQVKYLTFWGKGCSTYISGYLYFHQPDKKCTMKQSYFFHVTIAIEFLITLFFWVVIYDQSNYSTFFDHYMAYYLHIAPFTYLCIDFLFNKILLSHKSFLVCTYLMLFYLFNNYIIVRFFKGRIYPMITWES